MYSSVHYCNKEAQHRVLYIKVLTLTGTAIATSSASSNNNFGGSATDAFCTIVPASSTALSLEGRNDPQVTIFISPLFVTKIEATLKTLS